MSFFLEKSNNENIKVLDFPTTLGSIIEFLKVDIDNLTGFVDIDTDSIDWKKREKSELEKFKEILEFLIKSYPATNGKVIISYLETNL